MLWSRRVIQPSPPAPCHQPRRPPYRRQQPCRQRRPRRAKGMNLVVDSSIFVGGLDPNDALHQECVPLIERIVTVEIEALCPALVLVETTCVFRRRTTVELAFNVKEALARLPSILWLDINSDVAERGVCARNSDRFARWRCARAAGGGAIRFSAGHDGSRDPREDTGGHLRSGTEGSPFEPKLKAISLSDRDLLLETSGTSPPAGTGRFKEYPRTRPRRCDFPRDHRWPTIPDQCPIQSEI